MRHIAKDRFALGSYHYLRYPLDYFLDTAVELEMGTVELWAAAPHLCLDILDGAALTRTAQQLRERDLRVCCITPEQVTYPVNLASEDEALRAYSIRNFQRAIDAAHALECPMVLVTAGCGYFNHPADEAWARSADSMIRLAQYALRSGVKLVLETLTPLSSNVLNTPEQQREMLDLLPWDSALAMVDIGQMVYMGHDLSHYLAHGHRLGHVHLHDSHPAIHMALGDGDLPLASYLEAIEESGYAGKFGFEFNDPRYRQDPRAADLQSVAWLRDHHIFPE